jgi:hypothetical protein
MADIIKYDMTDIWATAGDVVAPDSAKIKAGWGVEVVPRQWWNWFENRQDQNIAYMLQKGFPEWDATTQYIVSKSYVQRNGIVYKATATSTNDDPTNLTSWIRAFADYSVASTALGALTPAVNQLPYFTGTSTAATTTLSPFIRTLLDDADDATVRATISAQQSNVNLTSLSGVTAVANGLPYFTGTTAMGIATLTAFGRSFIASNDAIAARAVLGVDSSVDVTAALNAAIATRQPLNATLTALATATAATNKLPYFTSSNTAATTDISVYSRTLLDDADATTARATLEVDSSITVAANLAAGLATKQPLNTNLTIWAGLTPAANTLSYWTGTNVAASTAFTALARTLAAVADTPTYRASIGVDSSATVAANLTAGLATKQPLNANLTTLASLSSVGDSLAYFSGTNAASLTGLTAFARTILDDVDAATTRGTIGADNASNLTSGVIPLARIPTALTGVNAATATALQTARTIQGVSFNGTANITLPVVSQDSVTGAANMPAGATGARPATPSNGMLRYNSDLASFEGYQAGVWSTVGGSGLGSGQSWSDMTASRALSTTYTNSTGKPIFLSITTAISQSGIGTLTVAGNVVATHTFNNMAAGGQWVFTTIVPNGATFSLSLTGTSISKWWELR